MIESTHQANTKKLPSSLTTVTTFSKILALILFISLPFVGFYVGIVYQQQISPPCSSLATNRCPSDTQLLTNTHTAIPAQIDISDWQTYNNTNWELEFKYPDDYFELTEDSQTITLNHNPSNTLGSSISLIIQMNPNDIKTSNNWISNFMIQRQESSEQEIIDYNKSFSNDIGGRNTTVIQVSTPHDFWTEYLTSTNSQTLSIRVYGIESEITKQVLSTFKLNDSFAKEQSRPCNRIPSYGNDPAAGISFLQNYCMGNYCDSINSQEECEAIDVVTLQSDNTLKDSWQPDGIGDCIWEPSLPDLNQCQPKY